MEKNYKLSIPKDVIGSTLIEVARDNEKICVLSSDVSVSCNVEMFNEIFPKRFFEMGIAEQSTMSVAGGLATEGMIPIYVALAIFSCGMTYPQLRQVCNANLNVKVIGTHAGVDDGQDGSGHHATEDIAVARAIPRLAVLTPSDENEVGAAIKAMINYNGPVYMRVAREIQPVLHDQNYEFEIGKVEVIEDLGNDFAILYEGSALKQALEGFEKLKKRNIFGKLISVRTIKPFDAEYINKLAKDVDLIITVENHSIVGGLYSTLVECLGKLEEKPFVKAIGFSDVFMESGKSEEIKLKYGLSGTAIVSAYDEYIYDRNIM